jgi:hypothetical protein
MTYPWQPLERPEEETGAPDGLAAWSELFATTIAHLAAQLTMTQLRLRALASVASEQGMVDRTAVAERLAGIAETESETYLRENLGAELAEAIDLESLKREIVAYLRGEAATA